MKMIGKLAAKAVSVAVSVAALFGASGASAQKLSDDVVRIGVLTDMSGVYSDFAGQGAVTAAKMALEDYLARPGAKLAKKVEIVSADHQNKADIAANLARTWYERDKVDAIVELVGTAVALAAMEVADQKGKITLLSGPASLPITNEKCTATNVHWTYDTYALSNGTAKAVVDSGKKTWYFLAADYAFGAAMVRDASEVVNANGGKVLGVAKHPFPNQDFSSFLLTAQQSKADVIALANGGQDTVNAIKQAGEFGILGSKQIVVPMILFINDVHSLGLKAAQGLMLTEGFYWNRNEKTRAWSRRYFERMKKMPSMVQAGVYSSVWNYLLAIERAGTDEAADVMKALKSVEIDDGLFKGRIRDDGKFAHDMLLMQVKTPAESKEPWDYYHVRGVIPAEQAALPLSQSKCRLVKK
ncbi:MAG: hypothetical protein RIS35_3045 [Pseudomonadota bacterium]|jgi:branched-chain amino acid transport system substrate-binding protein